MPNLSDSCLVNRYPVSIRTLAKEVYLNSGVKFPLLSLRSFVRDAPCPHEQCVTIHLKTLHAPIRSIYQMLVNMRIVFGIGDIGVRVASREDLTGPAFTTLIALDVSDCATALSSEQRTLFSNRNGVNINEIVIYFVRQVTLSSGPDSGGVLNGCAHHPNQSPGAVIADIASPWTLAHEVGHVLRLSHIPGENGLDGKTKCSTPDPTQLMTGCGTGAIREIPGINAKEIKTMKDSPLTQN